MSTGAERLVLALDIGGTKIQAGLVAQHLDSATPTRLRLHAEVLRCPTPASDGPQAVVASAVALGRRVLASAGLPHPEAIGLASAGIIDVARGTVTHATDSLPGWPGTPLAAEFTAAFDAPCTVLNDVHAHGLGEALCGVGAEAASLLQVAVGTGIGGALITRGEVLTGTHGAAGHIGHLPCPEAQDLPCTCGRSGHLEALASGPGIAAAYARRIGADPSTVTARTVAEHAAAGERAAVDVLTTAGRATGRMIGGLLNAMDPDVVAITGGVSGTGPLWWQALAEGVRSEAMDAVASTPVLEATAGNHAALLGAAHRALSRPSPDR